MNKRVLIVLLVILIGGVAVYALASSDNKIAPDNTNPSSNTTSQKNIDQNSNQTQSANTQTITYDNNGFSPQKLTARSGDTIVIQNKSDSSVQFSSNPHPTHTINQELNQDALAPGGQQSFTVTAKGTFGFHNHLDPSQTGSLVVQ